MRKGSKTKLDHDDDKEQQGQEHEQGMNRFKFYCMSRRAMGAANL